MPSFSSASLLGRRPPRGRCGGHGGARGGSCHAEGPGAAGGHGTPRSQRRGARSPEKKRAGQLGTCGGLCCEALAGLGRCTEAAKPQHGRGLRRSTKSLCIDHHKPDNAKSTKVCVLMTQDSQLCRCAPSPQSTVARRDRLLPRSQTKAGPCHGHAWTSGDLG